MFETLIHFAILFALPPLMLGVVNRTKALVAGRKGPPLLQAWYNVIKLMQKGSVYAPGTTWLFRAGPIAALATTMLAGMLVPLAGARAPLSFAGDVIVFASLLALGRFFTMAAALDTGSAFQGMGASREATFSAFAEPALFFTLAILCIPLGAVSFETALAGFPGQGNEAALAPWLIAAAVLFVVMLAESSRIPFDDPNTHLELTMIHEVMVLDHGGLDLALIQYGQAMKLFLYGALLVHLALPIGQLPWGAAALLMLAGLALVAVLIGLVESTMARLRLSRVPQFLLGASVIATIAVAIVLYRGRP